MVYFTRHRVHQCAVMQNIHMLHIGLVPYSCLVMPICPLNLIILCAFSSPPPLTFCISLLFGYLSSLFWFPKCLGYQLFPMYLKSRVVDV